MKRQFGVEAKFRSVYTLGILLPKPKNRARYSIYLRVAVLEVTSFQC